MEILLVLNAPLILAHLLVPLPYHRAYVIAVTMALQVVVVLCVPLMNIVKVAHLLPVAQLGLLVLGGTPRSQLILVLLIPVIMVVVVVIPSALPIHIPLAGPVLFLFLCAYPTRGIMIVMAPTPSALQILILLRAPFLYLVAIVIVGIVVLLVSVLFVYPIPGVQVVCPLVALLIRIPFPDRIHPSRAYVIAGTLVQQVVPVLFAQPVIIVQVV